jgi:cobalt-precorrin-5B (C1)-methyltransferase
MTKLAQGHLDLHSKTSSIDLDFLAAQVIALGGSDELVAQVKSANTSIEVLKLCQSNNIDLASEICQQALSTARKIVPSNIALEVWAINRQSLVVGKASE